MEQMIVDLIDSEHFIVVMTLSANRLTTRREYIALEKWSEVCSLYIAVLKLERGGAPQSLAVRLAR